MQNHVRVRGFRRRFGRRFGYALVQNQVGFNTVLENVLTFKNLLNIPNFLNLLNVLNLLNFLSLLNLLNLPTF